MFQGHWTLGLTQILHQIGTNDYFLTQSEIQIEDDAIALIEEMELGESDGHSSGAHQFDFNLINIQDFDKAMAIRDLPPMLSPYTERSKMVLRNRLGGWSAVCHTMQQPRLSTRVL